MIELERHIEILLLSNDCVIVPELGGFMAHHVEARYDKEEQLFLPPYRTLGFNPQLRLNDHLLVQSYIEAYDISYPEALRRIEDEVNELKQRVETDGEYELNDIGILRLNEEGHYEFIPCEAGILTPDLYGLSTFEMRSLDTLSEEAEADSAKIINIEAATENDLETEPSQTAERDGTVTISMSWVRNVAAIAAAILAFFIIGTPISNSDSTIKIEQSSVIPTVVSAHSDSQPAVPSAHVAKTETTETTPAPQSQPVKSVKEQPKGSFTIVLASQTPVRLAEDFIGLLGKKGYNNVRMMEMSNTSKVRVVYESYSSLQEAQTALRSLRAKESVFHDAWVMEIKK